MSGLLRAVAVDFDGTLTTHGRRPAERVLDAMDRARASGVRLVLVTGRILSELLADFPDVAAHVDCVVAENGCVVWTDGVSRPLVPPVDEALAEALTERGVVVRPGEVLLAGAARDATDVLAAIRDAGLEAQIVLNRSELMVVPAGATKGTGLFEALGDLGVSHHNTVGVGDAENDHSLLDVCEVGAVVANAVPALRRHADLQLAGNDGDGVAALLDGPVLSGRTPVHSDRWRLTIGSTRDGDAVSVPASQVNLLVCGETGLGKSYCAGLVAERLIALGYCVLVVDPEGDHRELSRLRGTVLVDSWAGLPSAHRVTDLIRHRFSSVVLDLSGASLAERQDYLDELVGHLQLLRSTVGLPHWLILDEAHGCPRALCDPVSDSWSSFRGYCLATYRPADLDPRTIEGLDAVLALSGGRPLEDDVVGIVGAVGGLREAEVRHLAGGLREREALLGRRPQLGGTVAVSLAVRTTPQTRHQKKYGTNRQPPERWFYFRDGQDRLVDVATNLADLREVVRTVEDSVLAHHATRRDISRWVLGVFHDDTLAEALAVWEDRIADGSADVATARRHIVGEVATRYPR